jgi:hypothetical protein
MEAIRSSETLVLKRATRRYIPEDGILHSNFREELKLATCVQLKNNFPRKLALNFANKWRSLSRCSSLAD